MDETRSKHQEIKKVAAANEACYMVYELISNKYVEYLRNPNYPGHGISIYSIVPSKALMKTIDLAIYAIREVSLNEYHDSKEYIDALGIISLHLGHRLNLAKIRNEPYCEWSNSEVNAELARTEDVKKHFSSIGSLDKSRYTMSKLSSLFRVGNSETKVNNYGI